MRQTLSWLRLSHHYRQRLHAGWLRLPALCSHHQHAFCDEHNNKIQQPTTDATATYDDALTTGVDTYAVDQEDAKLLYCNAKDKEWLLEQLQNDITISVAEPWIL